MERRKELSCAELTAHGYLGDLGDKHHEPEARLAQVYQDLCEYRRTATQLRDTRFYAACYEAEDRLIAAWRSIGAPDPWIEGR